MKSEKMKLYLIIGGVYVRFDSLSPMAVYYCLMQVSLDSKSVKVIIYDQNNVKLIETRFLSKARAFVWENFLQEYTEREIKQYLNSL